jgi:hypothetical protein
VGMQDGIDNARCGCNDMRCGVREAGVQECRRCGDAGMRRCGLRAAGCGLRAAGCGLREMREMREMRQIRECVEATQSV